MPFDDEERKTCPKAGRPGHYQCGMCPVHAQPRFECGCLLMGKRQYEFKGETDGPERLPPTNR